MAIVQYHAQSYFILYVHMLQSSESDDLFNVDSDGFEEAEEELETAVKCDGEHEVQSASQPVCYI